MAKVHPRARGSASSRRRAIRSASGSSPYARGGSPWWPAAAPFASKGHPRARGHDLRERSVPGVCSGSSPGPVRCQAFPVGHALTIARYRSLASMLVCKPLPCPSMAGPGPRESASVPGSWKQQTMTREQARLILGVEADASSDDIRSAHRRMMRTVHPDTNTTEEAERLAQMANEAREVLDTPDDDPEPGDGPKAPTQEPDIEAVQQHLPTVADTIRTYLDTDPERELDTDVENPRWERHVCRVVWDELDRQGATAAGMGEAVCWRVCQTDFLENGNAVGYWIYRDGSLRSVLNMNLLWRIKRSSSGLDTPDGSALKKRGQSLHVSTVCMFIGLAVLFPTVGSWLAGGGGFAKDAGAALFAGQGVCGAGAYRSRKRRHLHLVPNTEGRRRWEHGGFVASVLCGLGGAVETADFGWFMFTIAWSLCAYVVADTYGTEWQQKAKQSFEGAKYAEAAPPSST